MHYRGLTVWQKVMDVAKEVYRLAPMLPREETYGMRSQLTRAAISVPANIPQGRTRESAKEKTQFLAIAQGSLAEAETLLTLCEEMGWFPVEKTTRLRTSMTKVGKMLATMRLHFRQSHSPVPPTSTP